MGLQGIRTEREKSFSVCSTALLILDSSVTHWNLPNRWGECIAFKDSLWFGIVREENIIDFLWLSHLWVLILVGTIKRKFSPSSVWQKFTLMPARVLCFLVINFSLRLTGLPDSHCSFYGFSHGGWSLFSSYFHISKVQMPWKEFGFKWGRGMIHTPFLTQS